MKKKEEIVVAIVLAGGTGKRMGGKTPKQFLRLGKKTMLAWSLCAFDRSDYIDEIIIVCHKDYMKRAERIAEKHVHIKSCKIIKGGSTRQNSAYNGLKECREGTKYVLIHDAARPFVNNSLIKDLINAARKRGAVIPVIDSSDTIVTVKKDVVEVFLDRSVIRRVQTPQAFKYKQIMKAHELAIKMKIKDALDDSSLVLSVGEKVFAINGDRENRKITNKTDIYE